MSVIPMHRTRKAAAPEETPERLFTRLLARLAAHSIDLRDATTELYDIHNRFAVRDAAIAADHLPGNVSDAYTIHAATGAILECEIDRPRSEVVIALAERQLGQVLTLPCGTRVGPAPVVKPEPLLERDLW